MVKKEWAAVYATDEFICIQTCSGLRRVASDPMGSLEILSASVTSEELGTSLKKALGKSRILTPEEIPEFFNIAAVEKRYEEWVALLMSNIGYSSRREMFKKMKHCQVESVEGEVVIRPMAHEKLESWSARGIEEDDYVCLQRTSSDRDMGEGMLLALRRCIA